VDVWIVFGVYVLEFWMECFISGAGESGISFIDLDEGVSLVEVGVVIVTGQPAGGGVRDLIGLGRECLVLDKAAEWFCVAEV